MAYFSQDGRGQSRLAEPKERTTPMRDHLKLNPYFIGAVVAALVATGIYAGATWPNLSAPQPLGPVAEARVQASYNEARTEVERRAKALNSARKLGPEALAKVEKDEAEQRANLRPELRVAADRFDAESKRVAQCIVTLGTRCEQPAPHAPSLLWQKD
jgi:membrane-bound lytic murein transglycosylase B